MARASNYAAGDTVIFTRQYKTLGVGKGDERTVARLEHNGHSVVLKDERGSETLWKPYLIAGAKGGVEVYRSEGMELRAGDRVRWTRNDPATGLANGETATVNSTEKAGVRFRLEDGSLMKLSNGDPQLRHIDRAFVATVHAFQGRTVDRIIAAMPTGNARLTNQQAFYVAISRARDRADLLTDDAWKLADQLERATGERVAALDATARQAAHEAVFGVEKPQERGGDRVARVLDTMDRGIEPDRQTHREHQRGYRIDRETGQERDRISRERSAERKRTGAESGDKDREPGEDPSRIGGPVRGSEYEKAAEPKQKSVEIDLGL